MRAAFYRTTGGPEVIQVGDLPTPTPGPTEVLVRVGAASVNPIDLYIRAGTVSMPLPQPFIPGCDLAGTVEAVGADVVRFQPGDRVWGSNQGLLGRQGTFAEYACVDEDWLYPTPAHVSDAEAAAGALVGITAHIGLFRCARLQADEIVFVHGGTGGVGSMVVQMTKAAGGKVITTVGSAEKADLCRSWGADLVLNYKTDDIAAAIRDFTQGEGVHVWYETQREPDFVSTVGLLRRRGRMVIMAGRQAQPIFPVGPFYVKDLSLFGFAMFNAPPLEQRICAEDINRWLSEKKLKVPIGKTFSLAEAAEAHRFLEANTLHKAGTLIGKVVVVP
ncbi:MAG: NADPH:quinone reductase [Gemmataceae bacterium]|nr:NADPH:quinone reductase [Gemmataceae bacterium]MDW8266498.1 NADPH:quinone reductase [Gemmataceae bacterium]